MEANQDKLMLWKFEDADENEEAEMLAKYTGNAAAAALDPTLCLGHNSVVEGMISAIIEDRDPDILPMEAIKSVRIVNAVYESAKTGKTVEELIRELWTKYGRVFTLLENYDVKDKRKADALKVQFIQVTKQLIELKKDLGNLSKNSFIFE